MLFLEDKFNSDNGEKFLTNNAIHKSVFISTRRENQFTHLITREQFTFVLKFLEFNYLDESTNGRFISKNLEDTHLFSSFTKLLIIKLATFTAEIRLINPHLQRVKFLQLLVAIKELFFQVRVSSFLKNLFTAQTLTGNDVITWLPGLDWKIAIIPVFSRLLVQT